LGSSFVKAESAVVFRWRLPQPGKGLAAASIILAEEPALPCGLRLAAKDLRPRAEACLH